jgi:hypothetical protein
MKKLSFSADHRKKVKFKKLADWEGRLAPANSGKYSTPKKTIPVQVMSDEL